MNRDSHVYINEMLKKVPVPQASIWIAKTSQGITFLNHQPHVVEQYIAGPFGSRETANQWLNNRRKKRIDRLTVAALTFAALTLAWAVTQ